MTEEEFRRLMEQARREAAKNVFSASGSDEESAYEIAARHAESGASAH
ncbi:hypothetical protein R1T08_12835 [Streptomyces sp. SBC-4]|nr:hypothetical protein [Streptomyces sp. SBC-4]MDV5145078.1 hypothetical protein [Streptomyces sp. SBC-4]